MEREQVIKLKEMLESKGWVNQHSSWDREDATRFSIVVLGNNYDSYHMEKVISEQDVWQISIASKVRIVHANRSSNKHFVFLDTTKDSKLEEAKKYPIMEFDLYFLGTIANEEELIKVMQQVGCPLE